MRVKVPIKGKFTLWGLALILSCAIPLCVAVYLFTKQLLAHEIEQRLQAESAEKLHHINQFLSERYADLQLLVSDGTYLADSSLPIKKKIAYLRRLEHVRHAYASISLYDTSGVRVGDTRNVDIGKHDYYKPFFQAALTGNYYYDPRPIESESLDIPVIHFSAPVANKNNEVLAVVVMRVSIYKLYDLLKGAKHDEGGHDAKIDLINSDGLILYSNYDRQSILSSVIAGSSIFKLLKESKAVTGSMVDEDLGEPYLTTYVKNESNHGLVHHDWYLISRVRTQEVYAPIISMFQVILVSLTVSMSFGVILTFISAHNLSKYVIALKDMVDRYGKGKDAQVMKIRTGDEIEQLAIAFEKMMLNLNTIEKIKKEKQVSEAANAAKTEFLANMSHEMRTPLNAIIGFSELMQGTNLDDHQREYQEIILASSNSLLSVINDILDFSKIEAQKRLVEKVDFELNKVIGDAVAISSARLRKGDEVKLSWQCDDQLPAYLHGDPTIISQILINLVTNAIKFTERGYVAIHVSCLKVYEDQSIKVKLSVKDSGIGIPEEKLDSIFEHFTQADFSTTRKYGGTGLGLTITKSLVELLGGEISVHSRLHQGSEFSVEIVLAPATQQALNSAEVTPDQVNSLSEVSLIITDDDKFSRDILSKHAAHLGLKLIKCFISANEALDFLNQLQPNELPRLIVTDIFMPGMDGYTFTKTLRSNERYQGITIIGVSSETISHQAHQALNSGFNAFIAKPVLEKEFQKAVFSVFPSVVKGSTVHMNTAPLDEKKKILVAEDNEVNQMLIKKLLQKLGYEPLLTNNGAEALSALKKPNHNIQLVLMDLQMPQLSGIEATKQIRGELGQSQLPIIALTASTLLEEHDASFQAGINDLITKPVKLESLQAILDKYL